MTAAMLRNPPSKISLNNADVDQLKQRLKLRQAPHPIMAQTNWAAITSDRTYQKTRLHQLPSSPPFLRRGPQRSRDDCLVQVNPSRYVPQSATSESVDPAEDSDSSKTGASAVESTTHLAQIPEVSSTITQVPGYDPPAALIISPEQSPVRNRFRSSESVGSHQHHPGDSPINSQIDQREAFDGTLDSQSNCSEAIYPRRGVYPAPSVGRRSPESFSHSALLDPHAPAFVPRVRFGSVIEESSYRRSSLSSESYSGEERLRLRSASSRNLDPPFDPDYPRRSLTRQRMHPAHAGLSHRGSRRISATVVHPRVGHARPSAPTSVAEVLGRYPVFAPTMPNLPEPRASHRVALPREPVFRRRAEAGPSSERKGNHVSHRNPRIASQADVLLPVRPRASSSSLSAPNLVLPSQRPIVHSRNSSSGWNCNQTPRSSSTSIPSIPRRGDTSKVQIDVFPPPHSPLEQLTHQFRRLSAGLSVRSGSTSDSTGHRSTTEDRLLSGTLFYSDFEDEIEMAGPVPGYHGNFAQYNHPQQQAAPAAVRTTPRDTRDMTTQQPCANGVINSVALSPSSQSSVVSSESAYGVGSSVPDSSPSAALHHQQVPITPGRRPLENSRPTITAASASRARATPRVRVYDDGQPTNTQPRTPADLMRRPRAPVNSHSPGPGGAYSATGGGFMGYSPLIPPRNLHRNTYPSVEHALPTHRDAERQNASPYSPNFELRNAAAFSAVERRRTIRATTDDQENLFDPAANGMEAEREIWMNRRANIDSGTVMDVTPPQESRYERYLSS